MENTRPLNVAVVALVRAWAANHAYLRTEKGFAYFGVFSELFLQRIAGGAVQSRQTSERAAKAMFIAIWRYMTGLGLLIHADQGGLRNRREWAVFLRK